MARAAALGLPVAVHAESAAIACWPPAGTRAGATACATTSARARSRPSSRRSRGRSRSPRRPAARCTSSTSRPAAASALVAEARQRGVDVTCETCPHYLAPRRGRRRARSARRPSARRRCAPRDERDELWAALLAGDVDFVASDHSPAPPAMKQATTRSPPGAASPAARRRCRCCSTRAPRPGAVVRLAADARPPSASASPARAGSSPARTPTSRSSRLDDPWTLERADLRYRHRHSPYVGRRFRCRVVRTLVRGGAAGGRLVRPA